MLNRNIYKDIKLKIKMIDWKISKNIMGFALFANIALLTGWFSQYGFSVGQRLFNIPAEYIGIALLGYSLFALYDTFR